MESQGPRYEARRVNKLWIGITIVLVLLVIVVAGGAYYFVSNETPKSQSTSATARTAILLNQGVIASGGYNGAVPVYAFAGAFSAPKQGYLVVTGVAQSSEYQIALEIVTNNTSPDSYSTSNGTQVPVYYPRPDSANSTLITSSFANYYAKMQIERGNVSIWVESASGASIGAELNATYYY